MVGSRSSIESFPTGGTETRMPLNVGSRLGHYDVTALIGEGGMGENLGSMLVAGSPR